MENNFSKKIMGVIKDNNIQQHSRSFFYTKYGIFWTFSILVVILGALSTSITIFLFFDYDLEAKLSGVQSLTDIILMAIPIIWLLVILALGFLGVFSVKHTKYGYKYTSKKIIVTIITLNILLGIIFNVFDLGESINLKINNIIMGSNAEMFEEFIDQ